MKSRIGRYAFDTSQLLPELSTQWGDAYAADPHPDHPNGLYAFLINHRLPARLDVLAALENGKAGILQPVLGYEVVQTGGLQKLGFMMERPPGAPLVTDLSKPFQAFREDDLRMHLIKPLFDTLVSLQERALFHGGISPMRLFAKSGLSPLMLGDCVTLPPGYTQTALFEPIERAQCNPEGKGDSTIEDDIFAMGVTAFLMANGNNPFVGMSDEELIRARLEAGTATLLLNHAKLPPTILELVRGVCGDQPKQRWNFGEIDNWISGNRVNPRTGAQPPKASRALIFNGKEYFRPRNLASAFSEKPPEVRKIIESKELLLWIQRSLGDAPLLEEVKSMLDKIKINETNDDVLAARVAIALDPHGPIRYKSLRVMPSGLGTALCKAYLDKEIPRQQAAAEVIAADLISYWTSQPGNGAPHVLALGKDIEQARGYLNAGGMGFGLERAVYELQRQAPCYSEYTARYCVVSLKQLLPALDELAADPNRPTDILDRHVAGFLAARMGRAQENLLKALNPSKDAALRCIAVLNLLANVQGRYDTGPLPRLASWLADTLKPALDRFNSKSLKLNLQKNLNKLAAQGDLSKLQQAIDSPEVVEGDLQGFRNAARQYMMLAQQMREVQILVDNKDAVGMAVGQRLAASISVTLGLIAVAAAIVRAVQGL